MEWIVSVDEWQETQRAAASRAPDAASPAIAPCATRRQPDSAAAAAACLERSVIEHSIRGPADLEQQGY
ncbi:hypothetical protein ASE11_23045 [Hydrogenophaga sp. Root209]|nr:hypothetical protein ASE11_23045 [Hydrogenophaga sp. Root209]